MKTLSKLISENKTLSTTSITSISTIKFLINPRPVNVKMLIHKYLLMKFPTIATNKIAQKVKLLEQYSLNLTENEIIFNLNKFINEFIIYGTLADAFDKLAPIEVFKTEIKIYTLDKYKEIYKENPFIYEKTEKIYINNEVYFIDKNGILDVNKYRKAYLDHISTNKELEIKSYKDISNSDKNATTSKEHGENDTFDIKKEYTKTLKDNLRLQIEVDNLKLKIDNLYNNAERNIYKNQ